MIDAAITELTPLIGIRTACRATGRPQANHYRRHRQTPAPPRPGREPRPQPRALSAAERDSVRALLNSPDFADMAPAAVYHTLLDEGVYVASVSSMYRILRAHGEVRERRRHAVHPPKVKPELIADAPNRVWSWDITKLRGPAKRDFYHLYSVIDIYSRYTVAWLLAEREDAALAERLLSDAITKQGVAREQLTIHADRGTSMASKTVAQMMADLGVTKSHSRPRCSNDNPFSEAQFKTLKYRPDFPDRFGSVQDARAHCRAFFTWYNTIHRHSGIGWHTPHDVHHGHARQVRDVRADVLTAAYTRNPERFVRGIPQPPALPTTAWINKPEDTTTQSTNP
ncbi:IS3 family transposase [Micromonospora sp. WMMA1363]|uniref:IS3 family transposase n=1 Tax=Micromonospora sp. WMMA1363 TaxID=3053985 RepID=UPI00259C725B|nr:IS3 family transposase [Micromonospora sp. WMMA1363]MDM4720019.1 IS3 family transposase [Micromonospora sp. WMMA1363]